MSTRMLFCVLFLCQIVVSSTGVVFAERVQPNIVYILADDLGYGDVQCLNKEHGKIKTPHLDKLASQGMTFTDAHSGSSVCTPTRYGLLTGRYAWRTRLQQGVLSDYVTPLIAADRLTVPALLKQHGYHTACIGKWHLGYTIEGGKAKEKPASQKGTLIGAPLGAVTKDGPITRGFDLFFGFHHARMMGSLFENDRVTKYVASVDMLSLIASRASQYIGEQAKSKQPFFLYVPLSSPHTPIVPETKWQGKSGLGDYGDFVMQTDDAVGQVLAALDRAGVADNTLVIFTSDNGCSPAAGTGKLEKEGHFASGPYRGYKADIWDGGHRVPFFVRWPGHIKPNSTSQQIICHTDLMATCAQLLETKLPDSAGEDSVSILPALLGKEDGPLREAVVHHSISGQFSIRQGQWKLAFCAGSGGWGSPGDNAALKLGLPAMQLYDMTADPGEKRSVSKENPDTIASMKRLLDQYIDRGRSTPGKDQANDTEVKIDKPNAKAGKDD